MRTRAVIRRADIAKLGRRLVEFFDDHGAIAERADRRPGVGESGIRLLHRLCNRFELS